LLTQGFQLNRLRRVQPLLVDWSKRGMLYKVIAEKCCAAASIWVSATKTQWPQRPPPGPRRPKQEDPRPPPHSTRDWFQGIWSRATACAPPNDWPEAAANPCLSNQAITALGYSAHPLFLMVRADLTLPKHAWCVIQHQHPRTDLRWFEYLEATDMPAQCVDKPPRLRVPRSPIDITPRGHVPKGHYFSARDSVSYFLGVCHRCREWTRNASGTTGLIWQPGCSNQAPPIAGGCTRVVFSFEALTRSGNTP